jgi:alkanesulfonate monooxygenase SsuD/methylene tetrahydromethanopterin reductase-like flavin-dependent oxidoreductase (luciferase family)
MFRTYAFTEMPYPYTPPDETFESVRVTLPNRNYDPELGYQLYQKYFDMYRMADELGLDIMLNEHHATATCVEPSVPMTLAVLARETERARLLCLGNPIANRPNPVRIAEEMAMADVISQGRLECGFVRGVPQEISACNVNPVGQKDRFWESADLIVKAWTTTDGPFNWEGRFYHHRQVNVWPRVYQEPHPPVWVPSQSLSTAAETAERGWNLATILNGVDGCRKMFDTYRMRADELGFAPPPPETFGYLGLIFVGETEAEAWAGARKLHWYLQHNKVADQFMDIPGYIDVKTRAAILKMRAQGGPLATPVAHLATASVEELVKDGYFFAGTPDMVLEQMVRFYDGVGGFGNFLVMTQGGTMGLELTVRSMELYATEVLPRFREYYALGNGSQELLDRDELTDADSATRYARLRLP